MRALAILVVVFFVTTLRAEVGVTDSEILLGTSLGITGPTAARVSEFANQINTYFKRVNDQGGIHGRKIRWITLDDGYDPKRAIDNVKKLIEEEKVFALLNLWGVPTNQSVLPIVAKSDIIHFAPVSGAENLRVPVIPNVYNLRMSYTDEIDSLVEYTQKISCKGSPCQKFAILHQEDALGQSSRTALVAALQKRKLQFVGAASYDRNAEEVSKQVAQIVALKPDVVLLASVAKVGVEFMKGAAKEGLKPEYLATASMLSSVTATGIKSGIGYNPNMYFAHSFPISTDKSVPIVKEFLSIMTEAKISSFDSIEGFVNAKAITEVLRKAGKDLNRKKFKETIDAIDLDLGGLRMKFTPTDHTAFDTVWISQIKGESLQPVTTMKR